jgi:hypothetical protein
VLKTLAESKVVKLLQKEVRSGTVEDFVQTATDIGIVVGAKESDSEGDLK